MGNFINRLNVCEEQCNKEDSYDSRSRRRSFAMDNDFGSEDWFDCQSMTESVEMTIYDKNDFDSIGSLDSISEIECDGSENLCELDLIME